MGYYSSLPRLRRLDMRDCMHETDALHTWLVTKRRGGMHVRALGGLASRARWYLHGRQATRWSACMYGWDFSYLGEYPAPASIAGGKCPLDI